eukprot:GILI01008043.1.p1 GENE.GILI01008043.1~~GILI01008043.1.p1  ORF type:complete len:247 (+),score=103.17 GILI01008043.1:99-839(+)
MPPKRSSSAKPRAPSPKAASPKATPKATPKLTPAQPAVVAETAPEKKPEPVAEKKPVEEPVETKKEEPAAPAAPKGWANIVRSDKPQGAKTVVSVVDPTKKVAPVVEEKKVEKVAAKTEEASATAAAPAPKERERERERRAAPIFYDIFVKGFPETIKESEVPEALGLSVAVSNTKIDTKNDKTGTQRAFVYIKLSQEDLAKQGTTRDAAIEKIISDNKNAKFAGRRLNVETIKERFEDAASKGKK